MKLISTLLCCLSLFAAGCDASSAPEDCQDALATGQPKLGPATTSPGCTDAGSAAATDATPASTGLQDALPGYTASGVFVNLGRNPCTLAGQVAGWDPSTGTCYPPAQTGGTGGVCGAAPSCGSHAPGTVLVWSSADPRFRYVDDPSGGYVCLPNAAPYVVSC